MFSFIGCTHIQIDSRLFPECRLHFCGTVRIFIHSIKTYIRTIYVSCSRNITIMIHNRCLHIHLINGFRHIKLLHRIRIKYPDKRSAYVYITQGVGFTRHENLSISVSQIDKELVNTCPVYSRTSHSFSCRKFNFPDSLIQITIHVVTYKDGRSRCGIPSGGCCITK